MQLMTQKCMLNLPLTEVDIPDWGYIEVHWPSRLLPKQTLIHRLISLIFQ